MVTQVCLEEVLELTGDDEKMLFKSGSTKALLKARIIVATPEMPLGLLEMSGFRGRNAAFWVQNDPFSIIVRHFSMSFCVSVRWDALMRQANRTGFEAVDPWRKT